MEHVCYNSWFSQYKSPFGAVLVGTNVNFSIQVPVPDVQRVELVIRNEADSMGNVYISLETNGDGWFNGCYQFDCGPGLYFYYFRITQKLANNLHCFFYGSKDGGGGEGVIYATEVEIKTYQTTCYLVAEQAPSWYRRAIAYQIFPDRFYNGAADEKILNPKKNSFIYGTKQDEPYYIRNDQGEIERWDFYGGNLTGIIKKIPYLKDLGISLVYLNPIFLAASNHRYDTGDFMRIDPVLGDQTTFQKLINEMHKHDIRVVLDGVFNHVGADSKYFNKKQNYEDLGAYQSKNSIYFDWFTFDKYPEEYKSWWGVTDLPEVNENCPTYQEYIYGEKNSVLAKWNQFGVDGWRLDVADELPDFFIQGIRRNLERYPEKVLIGEVWEDASNKIAYQQRRQYILGNMLHGVMNYPFRSIILRLIKQKNSPQDLVREVLVLQENYPKDVLYNCLNNIGTHDTERILTVLSGDEAKLELAVALLFVLPGVPCVYYGDEAGLFGEKDPDNRRFYPWGRENQVILKLYKKWIQIRETNHMLIDGNCLPFYTDHLFGIVRYTDNEWAVLVINPNDEKHYLDLEQIHFDRTSSFITESLQSELGNCCFEAVSCRFFSSHSNWNENK